MGHTYTAIGWNSEKKQYDLAILLVCAIYLLFFVVLQFVLQPEISPETLIIRSTGTLAILLLHVILLIGPLSRISFRFLPLLYNRRHLGVTMFIFAAVHGIFSLFQFHALGNTDPLISLFGSNTDYFSVADFPFQVLGFFALLILFLMAATSHDFWLSNLGPKTWKALHMMVYVAYGLLVMHILLGVLQQENDPVYYLLLGAGFISISGMHLWTALKGRDTSIQMDSAELGGQFIEVCHASEIPENRAKIVKVDNEEIAIFKYDGKISALRNECKHQLGPLGEGEIIDGCVTCPWHGYQYRPEDGQSPPPFTEKVSTYKVIIHGGLVCVDPKPKAEGTFVEPCPYQSE